MTESFQIKKCDYSKSNLSYQLFQNMTAVFQSQPLILKRVDFRGSKFINCSFLNNCLDRSDFIDCYLENIYFISTDFGSALCKNNYFKRNSFNQCQYHNTAFHECTFDDCTFENSDMNWIVVNCKFINCSFKNIKFDHSVVDTNKFIDCIFIKCSLAECHMENIQFQSCILRTVELDGAYIPTYLFKETDISQVRLKYHGEIVEIQNLSDTVQTLYEQRQYFHFLNMRILLKETRTLFEDIRTIIPELLKMEPQLRFFNMKNILSMFEFYYACSQIDFLTYQKIILYLNEIDFTDLPFSETIEYKALLCKISETNKLYDIPLSVINSIKINTKSILTVHINSDDSQKSYQELQKMFESLQINLLDPSVRNNDLYRLIGTEKGSIILILSASLLLSMLFAKVVKSIHNDVQQIRIEKATADKIINLTKESKNVSDLQEIANATKNIVANAEQNYLKTIKALSNSILIGEIISIAISLIF